MKRIFTETDKHTEHLLYNIQELTGWSMKRCISESLLVLGEKIGVAVAEDRYNFGSQVISAER